MLVVARILQLVFAIHVKSHVIMSQPAALDLRFRIVSVMIYRYTYIDGRHSDTQNDRHIRAVYSILKFRADNRETLMIAFNSKTGPLSIVNKARIVARLGAITVKQQCSVHTCDAIKRDNNLKIPNLSFFICSYLCHSQSRPPQILEN